MGSSYDTIEMLAKVRNFNNEAKAAASPSLRALCLAEAVRCARLVQESLQTPIIKLGGQPATQGVG